MIFDLAKDFSHVLAAMPPDNPRRRILALLEEALRRDIHFIARHSTTLFQCMWNTCWWYDCPEAAKHYAEPDGGWRLPPWEHRGVRLHSIIADWRRGKEERVRGLLWLRSLRPPAIQLGAGQKAVLRGHERTVTCVAFSPDGTRIGSGSDDFTLRLWDASTQDQLGTFLGHSHSVTSVAFSPDGMRLASGSYDKTVRVWDAQTYEELLVLGGHAEPVNSVAFSPSGTRIASGSSDKSIRVWDTYTGAELVVLLGHQGEVTSVVFSPDGTQIASGSDDCTVRLWDVRTGRRAATLCERGERIAGVGFFPDGKRIGAWSSSGTFRVWDTCSGAEVSAWEMRLTLIITSVAISPDGARIASASDDRTVRVWDAYSGAQIMAFAGHDDMSKCVAFSPDGTRVVSGSVDNTVRMWNVHGRAEPPRLQWDDDCNYVQSIALSTDGSKAASGMIDATVHVWDTHDGTRLHVLRGHREPSEVDGSVLSVAFSPDGSRLASGARDTTVRVWDVHSGAEVGVLRGHKRDVTAVAFSPNGKWIASGSDDATLRVWNAARGAKRAVWEMSRYGYAWSAGLISSVAFSPDGRWIAYGMGYEVGVVPVRTIGQPIALGRHESSVKSVSFSSDGKRIVSCSTDHSVSVWDVASQKCVEVIPGEGSVVAIVAGPAAVCYRALTCGLETLVQDGIWPQPAAFFPAPLAFIQECPSVPVFAGSAGGHLYFVALEGGNRP